MHAQSACLPSQHRPQAPGDASPAAQSYAPGLQRGPPQLWEVACPDAWPIACCSLQGPSDIPPTRIPDNHSAQAGEQFSRTMYSSRRALAMCLLLLACRSNRSALSLRVWADVVLRVCRLAWQQSSGPGSKGRFNMSLESSCTACLLPEAALQRRFQTRCGVKPLCTMAPLP